MALIPPRRDEVAISQGNTLSLRHITYLEEIAQNAGAVDSELADIIESISDQTQRGVQAYVQLQELKKEFEVTGSIVQRLNDLENLQAENLARIGFNHARIT